MELAGLGWPRRAAGRGPARVHRRRSPPRSPRRCPGWPPGSPGAGSRGTATLVLGTEELMAAAAAAGRGARRRRARRPVLHHHPVPRRRRRRPGLRTDAAASRSRPTTTPPTARAPATPTTSAATRPAVGPRAGRASTRRPTPRSLRTGLLAALAPHTRRTHRGGHPVTPRRRCAAPRSAATRPTRSAGCSPTCPAWRWRRRPRSARRPSRAAARTTPSRCRRSTSPTPSTSQLYRSALAARRGRLAQAVGTVTELVLRRARAATSCWCRWPGPAPRSGSCCAAGPPPGTA